MIRTDRLTERQNQGNLATQSHGSKANYFDQDRQNSLQRESVSTGKRKQEREDRTVGWGENPIGFGSFFYTWYLA
jgi:hypothetical protein